MSGARNGGRRSPPRDHRRSPGAGRAAAVPAGAPGLPGTLVWFGPLFNQTGFAEEGRGFVRYLRRRGYPVVVRSPEQGHSTYLPQLARSFPRQLLELNDAAQQPIVGPASALVHTPGAGIPAPPAGAVYAICRTMWETDGLTPEQVGALDRYDEVWVPSSFNAESFAAAGVCAPVVVVPEGVDVGLFRPNLDPLRVPGARGRVFLSIFEWSHRKGVDVLLAAWARAFRADDDVSLVLRCYPRNGFDAEDQTAASTALVAEALAEAGIDAARCAPIVVVGRQLSPAELPRLYAAADCYVAPSRGEGWGRPQIEAMACGLPVIGTRWSGNLEFMNEENSLLLDVEDLVTVDVRMDVPVYRGQRWAEPSVEHLTELLRQVAEDPKAAAAVGRRARMDVERCWRWEQVALRAGAELDRVGAAVREREAFGRVRLEPAQG